MHNLEKLQYDGYDGYDVLLGNVVKGLQLYISIFSGRLSILGGVSDFKKKLVLSVWVSYTPHTTISSKHIIDRRNNLNQINHALQPVFE